MSEQENHGNPEASQKSEEKERQMPSFAISGHVPNRLQAHMDSFVKVISHQGPSAEIEDHQDVIIKGLVPVEDRKLRLVCARLISEFINDPVGYVDFAMENHYPIMMNYGWMVDPKGEMEEPASAAEGYSIFWMVGSSNQFLDNLESLFLDKARKFMAVNDFSHYAARALLRMQAYHFEANALPLIADVHRVRWKAPMPERHRPSLKAVARPTLAN